MKILVIDQDWFVKELRDEGHEVISCGLGDHLDIVVPSPFFHIDSICERWISGFKPDRIIVHDCSRPITVAGLDELDIPTLYCSVDTHHHYYLHSFLYESFDNMVLFQKEYIPFFNRRGQFPSWLPLWAPEYVEASSEKKFGAVFVGTLDPELNPDRIKFFDALKQEIEVYCTSTGYKEIFPYSEIVINQSVKGDLNFRTFEAMMCGALLVTEKFDNGLEELFVDGKHLITYRKGDVKDAAEKIRYYLENIEQARAIAKAGREEVVANHTPKNRVKLLLNLLEDPNKSPRKTRSLGMMVNFTIMSQRMDENVAGAVWRCCLLAVKCLRRAIDLHEPFTEELALIAVGACLGYDLGAASSASTLLFEELCRVYPDIKVFQLARVRDLLNAGHIEEATLLAERELGVSITEASSRAEILAASSLEFDKKGIFLG